MSFERTKDALTFYCDYCENSWIEHDPDRDFATAWKLMPGWTTWKRTGSPWTHACRGCTPAAQDAHNAAIRAEGERERIKARNSK
jgi:hypothetical protein